MGRNVSRKQQSFSGFQSPKWSFSIKAIKILCFSGFSYLVLCLRFSLFFNKRECLLFYMCLKLPLNLGIKWDMNLHLGHNISYFISCPFSLSKIVCYYVIGYVLVKWRNTKKNFTYIQFVTQELSHNWIPTRITRSL